MTGAAARYVHRQAAFDLVVDGQNISGRVRPRLLSLRLTEKRGADADELEIVLDDSDGQVRVPPAGATITLRLGFRDLGAGTNPALVDKGSFKVDERSHEGSPDRLTIRAKSADLTRGFRTRRTQTWTETTLGAVIGEIASRNGLSAAVGTDLRSIAVPHLDQAAESDSALLSRLGRIHDAVATAKNGKLIFSRVGSGLSAGSGRPLPGATLTRRSGDRHRWQASEREAYSGVVAIWHDREAAERQEVVAGSDENPKRLGRVYGSEEAARRAAEAEFSRQERKAGGFSLELAIGRPDIYPDQRLRVTGFKPEIDAAGWLVTEATHSIDAAGGLRTSLQMELGGTGASPRSAS